MERVLGIKLPGHDVNDDWATRALAKFPSYAGVSAVVANEDGSKTMQTLHHITDKDHPAWTLEGFKELFGQFKEETVIFSMGRSATVVHAEDVMPFILTCNDDADSSAALVAYLAGDYNTYAVEGAALSPESFAVMKYLLPKLDQLVELVEGDVDKLMDQINKQVFRDDIAKMWTGTGTVIIHSDSDKFCEFHANEELRRHYPWGVVSHHCGHGIVASSIPDKVAAAGKSLSKSLMKAMPGAAAAKGPQPVVVGKLADPPVKDPVTDTAPAVQQKWFPPANLHGKPLKSLIRQKNKEFTGINDLPPGYDKPGFFLVIPPGKVANVLKSLADLPPVAGQSTITAGKKPPVVTLPKAIDADQPVVDPNIIEAVEEDFFTRFDHTRKVIDASNQLIMDPDIMTAMTNPIPPTWKQLGHDLEELFRATREDWQVLAHKYPAIVGDMCLFLVAEKMKDYKTVEPTVEDTVKASEPAGVASVPAGAVRKKTLMMPRKTA